MGHLWTSYVFWRTGQHRSLYHWRQTDHPVRHCKPVSDYLQAFANPECTLKSPFSSANLGFNAVEAVLGPAPRGKSCSVEVMIEAGLLSLRTLLADAAEALLAFATATLSILPDLGLPALACALSATELLLFFAEGAAALLAPGARAILDQRKLLV